MHFQLRLGISRAPGPDLGSRAATATSRTSRYKTSPVRASANRLPVGMVLRKGLEPLRLTAHAPQTCVSTNSTT